MTLGIIILTTTYMASKSECEFGLGELPGWICVTSQVLLHQSKSKNIALEFFEELPSFLNSNRLHY